MLILARKRVSLLGKSTGMPGAQGHTSGSRVGAAALRRQVCLANTSAFGTAPKPRMTIHPGLQGRTCFIPVFPASLRVSVSFHPQRHRVCGD